MKTNESEFLTTLQEFVAVTAVGVSALRNQGKGTIKYLRKMISKLNLSEIQNLSKENYKNWLNKKTDLILKTWPHSKKPWSAVRKALNLFMRDSLYNQYLNKEYGIKKIENCMEIPLDSFISKELIKRNKKLKWPGLKHLTFEQSEKFQEIANIIAKERNISKIHLDIFIWLNARNNENKI